MKIVFFLCLVLTSQTPALDKIGRPFHSPIKPLSEYSEYKPTYGKVDFEVIEKIFSRKTIVSNDFPISDSFNIRAKFWLYIYGVLPSSSVIIHSKSNLSIIYNLLDFSKLWQSKLSPLNFSLIQSDLAQVEVTKLKERIINLCKDKDYKKKALEIHASLVSDIQKPCSYYQKIANNLRLQTGKKDISSSSLNRYYNLKPFLDELHKTFNVPIQIDAIAFLESNFISYAHSHAGAYGIWQFMERTGNYFFPKINSSIDFRANPYTATLGAYHLLRQNFSILKSWELAIPAYNFGVNQILLAKRALKKDKISLDYLFKNYTSTTLGFASKNYYANFLAAAILIKDHNSFDIEKYKPKKNNISFYLTKCSLRPESFYRLFKDSQSIRNLNKHILKPKRKFKKGLLLVSDRQLTSRRYYKIPTKTLTKYYPKNLKKLVRKQRCN